MNDFIEEYKNTISLITDAPIETIEATAIFLLSVFAKRNFTFLSPIESNIDQTQGMLLNLWFLIIGKSRISRKSIIVSKAEEIINAIDRNILLPIDFTPQSAVREMAQKSTNGIHNFSWVNDECSGFFQRLNENRYMSAVDTILSRIYDGRTYRASTVTRGNEIIEDPYFCMFLATTDYIYRLLNENQFLQGFLNRFIFVPVSRSNRKSRLEAINNFDEFNIRVRRIVNWLRLLNNINTNHTMIFSFDIFNKFDEFEAEIEDMIENDNDCIRSGLLGNIPNILIKLSCLFRLSKITDFTNLNERIIIDEESFDRALKYTQQIIDWIDYVLTRIRTSVVSRKVQTDRNIIDFVYSKIKDFQEKYNRPISLSELYRETRMISMNLLPILDSLKKSELITEQFIKTRGRQKTVYSIIDDI